MDRNRRYQKSNGCLEGERGPDVLLVCQLGDAGRELCGVGNDGDTSDEHKRDEDSERRAEDGPGKKRCATTHNMLELVSVVRPHRSATSPAASAHGPPIAMVPNAISVAVAGIASGPSTAAILSER